MRRITRIVAVNLVLLLCGIVVVELLFGDWYGRRYDGRLRLLCDVEYRFDVTALYPARAPILYRRDRWCLRGAFASPAQVALVTIGGSTTEQRFLGEGETWQDRLAAHLQAAGHPLAIANAGLDGQSTGGHLVALEGWLKRIPELHPRFVILYVGINDAVLSWHAAHAFWGRGREPETADGLWRRALQEFRIRSATLELVRLVVGMVEARMDRLGHAQFVIDEATARWRPIGEATGVRATLADRLAAYAERLERLDRAVRAWGAVPIFVTQPRADRRLGPGGGMLGLVSAAGDLSGDLLALGPFNETTLAVCRRLGDICLDLAGELALGAGDYYDLEHYTPAGAEKIAAYLAEKLAHDLGLPQAAG